jgi:hypothetical protein
MDTSGLEACAWSAIRAAKRASSPAAAAAAHTAADRALRELAREAAANPGATVSARAWEALAQVLKTPNAYAAEAAAALVVDSGARVVSAHSAPSCDDLAVGALVQAAAAHGWPRETAVRTMKMACLLLQPTFDMPPSVRRAGRDAVAALVRGAARLPGPQDSGDATAWRMARGWAYLLLGRIVQQDKEGPAAAELLGNQGLLRSLVRDVPQSAPLVTALASSQAPDAARRVLEAAPELPRALAVALARGPVPPDDTLAALWPLCREGARARSHMHGPWARGRGCHAGGAVSC